MRRARTLWSVAALCTLGGALAFGALLLIVAPSDERAYLAWFFRHPAVLHEQAYGSDVFVDAFDRSYMALAIVLVVASHVVHHFAPRRRAVAGSGRSLSLSVFLIGSWSAYRPAVFHRDACMGSGNPAESMAYFALALVCLASHAPRLFRRA